MRQLQVQYLSNPEKRVEGYQEHRRASAMAAKLEKTNNPSKAFDLLKESLVKNGLTKHILSPFLLALKKTKKCIDVSQVFSFSIGTYSIKYF